MTRPKKDGASRAPAVCVCALAGLLACATGCTPKQYAHQADQAAYQVIAQKQKQALGYTEGFDITPDPFMAGVPGNGPEGVTILTHPASHPASQPASQPANQATSQPVEVLSLDMCLEIAARNNAGFQDQKEQLYTQALALANLRHTWSLVSGEVTGAMAITGQGDEKPDYSAALVSTPANPLLSFAQKFANGGVASLGLGLNAATQFLGINGTTLSSFINANFTQPLLRGAWHDFAYEGLYRAERDFAIAILQYQYYVQTFTVGIAKSYYNVLQLYNVYLNNKENLARLEETFKFVQAQVVAGMTSRVQADQAEQDVLNARDRIEISWQDYQNALDQFKIDLGLPLGSQVELKMDELEALTPQPVPLDEGQAIGIALHFRPDVLVNYAKVRDAKRDVEIAVNNFLPDLELVLAAYVPSNTNTNRQPLDFSLHQSTRSVGLTYNYPIDQTDNRDLYRRSLINVNRSERNLSTFLDSVRLDVTKSYRSLVQSRKSYEIQQTSVELATRRTALARFEQREGLASTRDVLDAEDALRTSKIAMIAALVSYTTTRLDFLAGVGMIEVDVQGKFHERSEPATSDRLEYYRYH